MLTKSKLLTLLAENNRRLVDLLWSSETKAGRTRACARAARTPEIEAKRTAGRRHERHAQKHSETKTAERAGHAIEAFQRIVVALLRRLIAPDQSNCP